MFCTSCFIIGIFAFNVFFERKKRYIWENPIFSVIALLSFAPEVQTAGHAALSKAAFFYCLFCEYLFWYDWTNRKIFFRQQRNAGSCFIFMFACFISRLALIVLRTICAYFLILQNSYFGFRFPFRCHRELGFLFDFKSRFYIFPLAYQWLFLAAWFCIMSLSVIIYLCFHPVSCLRFLSVWMVVRRPLHGCLADIFFALSAAFKTL